VCGPLARVAAAHSGACTATPVFVRWGCAGEAALGEVRVGHGDRPPRVEDVWWCAWRAPFSSLSSTHPINLYVHLAEKAPEGCVRSGVGHWYRPRKPEDVVVMRLEGPCILKLNAGTWHVAALSQSPSD